MNHEMIRRTLELHARKDPDASAIANATIRIWNEASARLAPVIGGQGIDVLLRRSLHVAGKVYPSLVEPSYEGRSVVLLESLQYRLANCDRTHAVEAGTALLVSLIELMNSLIGEPLTERLLAPIWAPLLPTPESKGTL